MMEVVLLAGRDRKIRLLFRAKLNQNYPRYFLRI